jgi:hypothetical protein
MEPSTSAAGETSPAAAALTPPPVPALLKNAIGPAELINAASFTAEERKESTTLPGPSTRATAMPRSLPAPGRSAS